MSELQQQASQLTPDRQIQGAPFYRVMAYWKAYCPTFLARLGPDAEAAALLRQDQYLNRFNELIEQGTNPFQAHQTADRETIYQPTAEADQAINKEPLHPIAQERAA